MNTLANIKKLKQLIDKHITLWHERDNGKISLTSEQLTENNLFFILAMNILESNYKLWHLEDTARDPVANDNVIADVKRKIDKENQLRNDKIEKLDIAIENYLRENNIITTSDEFNSETPGSIVDRSTILSLKIYHMKEQTERKDSSPEHIEQCKRKLTILHQQRDDLLLALKKLIKALLNGEKTHKIYYQFKMYNDPNLNPAIYSKISKTDR